MTDTAGHTQRGSLESPEIPQLRFDTEAVDAGDRLDALNTFSRGLYSYTPSKHDGTSPRLNLDAWALDDVAVAAIDYGPAELREADRLHADFEDMLFLRWVKSGRLRVEAADSSEEFGAGSVFLMQARHKLHALDDGTALSLRLPYGRLGYDPLANEPITRLRPDIWQVRVLVSALDALVEGLPGMSSSDTPAVAAQLSAMVRAVIDVENADAQEDDGVRSARVSAMRRYVIANLSRDDLGVAHLQAQFNASRATVYRAFEDVGGVARFVREKRLAAIHRDLRSAKPTRGTISRIAGQYGLWDQASFLRMFRAHYGVKPSDVLGLTHDTDRAEAAVSDTAGADQPSLASFWARRH